jgi:hypothetical protein
VNVVGIICDQCRLEPPVIRQHVDGIDLMVCVGCAFDLEAPAVAAAEENFANQVRDCLITQRDCPGGDVTTTPAGSGEAWGVAPLPATGGVAA